jgi:pimeloyl-ACP methyl ester carboxylesterase
MSSSTTANPATGFYNSALARSVAMTLRLTQTVAPAAAARLALRLFFTPMPLKLGARRQAVPAGWRIEQWPFEQGTIAVHRHAATADSGRPVVLLVHGWAGDAQQMHPLAEALVEAGLDPVLLDFPAHGRSSGWRSTLPQFVRAVWAASVRLGPLHALVAHSLGALAAAHAAANGLPVQRLALIATSPPPALFLKWFAGSLGLHEGMPGRMGAVIEKVEGVPLAHFDPGWLGPRLRQPTLVVHDEADRISPLAVGQRMGQAILGARLVVTRALGHRRVLADEAVVREVAGHLRPESQDHGRPNGSGM